jgi:predicted ester cyclase
MIEACKELGKLWFEEVWNKGRRAAIRELLAPGAVIYECGEAVRGAEGFYPFFDRMQASFSNIHVSIHDAIAEGDVVCLRWSCTMTHTGDGFGVPPTNKDVQTTGITIIRSANGKIVAGWQNWDMLGLMQQIKDEQMAPTYIAATRKG